MTLDILATVLTCLTTSVVFAFLDANGPEAQRVPRLGALAIYVIACGVVTWAIWS